MTDRPSGHRPRASSPLRRWTLFVAFWTVLVLVFSFRTEMAAVENVRWTTALWQAASVWYVWGLLSLLIVWVDRRLPVPGDALAARLLLHVPFSLLFASAAVYLSSWAARVLGLPFDDSLLRDAPFRIHGRYPWLVYWAIVGVHVAFEYRAHLKNRALRNAELERLLTESRLDALRTQLHPHFLFNTLNAISAHVEHDPGTARWMLDELGTLLRSSLEHAREQEIPLARELDFIRSYLRLQQVRFDDRLSVTMDVQPGVGRALVPALIVQPLIENAFRHGIARRASGGRIEIGAWRDGGSLRLRVRDNGPGLPPDWRRERSFGIGLANTQERLRQLYGDRQQFTIDGSPGTGVQVDLLLPYREEPGDRAEAEADAAADADARAELVTEAGAASARAPSDRRGS